MKAYPKIVVLALALLVGPAVVNAYAVSIKDLIALSKEGVSDQILIALIETDGSRFRMTADDIRTVRAAGLSDAVIVAMILTRPPAAPVRDGAVVSIEAVPPPAPIVIQTPAPPPVVVQQTVVQEVRVEQPRYREPDPVYVPVYIPVPTKPVEVKKEEPVYWGWGGKRRPDAWPEPVIIK